ncbi:ATP-dependent RNA helicase HrpA [Gimesia aquarii]|uniref:ATP-dependent RNA helicase HrpB n=1 Tax=Gimesia aquarii TaxID=2527964 RepID=A0A517WNZ3_9PLAN|nr:ATP-dependent RNA helicase HrpA [Gimesia aquarii]QDU06974.1 ATP-dependent RNA helicase HrpB [Gimesia aquarii]
MSRGDSHSAAADAGSAGESVDAALSEMPASIEQAMVGDQFRFSQRLRSIRQAKKSKKPFDKNLKRLRDELKKSMDRRAARLKQCPQITFDKSLPIHEELKTIKHTIEENQVVIVCGETGSGKSTQLPKLLLSMGRGIGGLIGHTQPRRIAARSVCARISEELGREQGTACGFKIRFTDTTNPNTYIKLMTDGILLAETQTDRFLNQYDTIIIDEAHERSLNIDFLLGFLKRLLPKRKDLRVIITSATIDADRFSEHFSTKSKPAPILNVSGRTYPVEIRYRPLDAEPKAQNQSKSQGNGADEQSLLAEAVNELAAIDEGDILIFVPTEWDIRETAKLLRGRSIIGDDGARQTEIVPLYGRLSTAEQNKVFRPSSYRRIVIATNVAESSITVPGIRYVIDTGLARISRYSSRSQVQRLPIEAVSQASANQRAGRCGRVAPGICIRLYSETDFNSRDEFTPPEILRTNLASVILQTLTMKLGAIEEFPFIDPPKPVAIRDGYNTLFELGAIDSHYRLTDIGRQLSRLPVDPRIARMILAAHDENCLHEILIIAAALELQDPRERPIDKQQAADEAHLPFRDPDSDFLSYLKLWDFYHKLKEDLSQSRLRKACVQNFLSYNRLREWADIFRQLRQLVEETGLKIHPRKDDSASIHRALLPGFLSNIAMRSDTNEYTGSGQQKYFLWPGSGVFEKKPKWIISAELIETSKRYARTVAKISPNWIEPAAAHLVKKSWSDPRWNGDAASAVATEKVTLFGLTIVSGRSVHYGKIEPDQSRTLLLQYGLVEGDISLQIDFLTHNQNFLEALEQQQAKSRRYDLIPSQEQQFAFYDERIPADVFDGVSLKKWWKAASRKTPTLLNMRLEDFFEEQAQDVDETEFPNALNMGKMQFPLEYHLEPGAEEDGVTVSIPQESLNQLSPHRLGWLVPGLLEEKVAAMIKALPKSVRRMLVPAPETARQVVSKLEFGKGSFEETVAEMLSQISGEPITADQFEIQRLPHHLQMNIRVLDQQGETIASKRNLTELRQEFGSKAADSFSSLSDDHWSQSGLTDWTFGDFPAEVQVQHNHLALTGFPSLLDEGKSVALCLRDAPERAAYETRFGLRRLFVLAEHRKLKSQVDHLPGLSQMTLYATSIGGINFKAQLIELLAERTLFGQKERLPRSEAQYRKLVKEWRNQIPVAAQDLASLLPELLEKYHRIKMTLEKTKVPAWNEPLHDMRAQLKAMINDRFLVSTPYPWLQQFPRYLEGIEIRLGKLGGAGLKRDLSNIRSISRYFEQYSQRARQHHEREIIDPQLIKFRWMLEEYRISLFAQKLGTALKISPKILDQQWAAVRD